MNFVYDDGGRAAAGFRGTAGDCVCRAIAIATGKPYAEVYDALNDAAVGERIGKRKRGKSSARTGVYRTTYQKLLLAKGWKFVATMGIGTGCRVHLHDGELPMGRLIVSVSRHLTAVIDGVIHDTHDPQRNIDEVRCENGVQSVHVRRRCVYGYWIQA